jgi:hypothetical protein
MIQVNLLSIERQALNAAVARTRAALRNRSFSARNSHLGRMINCPVCLQRHRENWTVTGIKFLDGKGVRKEDGIWDVETVRYQCVQAFAKPRYLFTTTEAGEIVPVPMDQRPELIADQTTLKGVYGAQAFAKKRHLPHHNRRDLLLVQRTIELYPEHAMYLAEPKEAMREARLQAQREIQKAQDLRSGKRLRKMKISRNSRSRKNSSLAHSFESNLFPNSRKLKEKK